MGDKGDNTFEREREILFAALEKKTEESRSEYLREACGDDQALLARIGKMLEQHHGGDETETFLKAPGVGELPGTLLESEGSVVGNYKIVEKLGEGGFGVVWMAEQKEPVQRKVALKLIKPGMDSAEVIARFGAERQALAVMDHPNIAKVFDAGATESGRPYFVMELADGVPITEFCDREKLTTKARLELFAVVCGAVQHAHQKAVIHRDLKPSNILVVDGDDGPVPKVIDFGIAKAIGEEAGAQTAFTAHGQLVGTPQYMSPEQAGMGASADIDTRSDVYSLGVVLYELLAGSPPFDAETLRSAGFEGMCRIIREEEPMRPSLKLGTAKGEDATRITGTRGAEPGKLSRQLRGELDWIVMKAIEKDRSRRYETANAFAADIGRYLNDEAVEAAAPSAAYRFRKFARRNKAAIGTVALIAAVLVAATGVSIWHAIEANEARINAELEKVRADEEAAIAKAVSAFLQLAIEESFSEFLDWDLAHLKGTRNPLEEYLAKPEAERGPFAYMVRDLVAEAMNRAGTAVSDEFKEKPVISAAVEGAVGLAYHDLQLWGKAVEHLEKSLTLYRSSIGPEHPKTLAAMVLLAKTYSNNGDKKKALLLYEQLEGLGEDATEDPRPWPPQIQPSPGQ